MPGQGLEMEVQLSYVEVYGMEVNDLLRERTTVGQSRVIGHYYAAQGHSAASVNSLEEVGACIQQPNETCVFV